MAPLTPRAVQNTAAAGTSALQTSFDAQRKKSAIIASVIAAVVLIAAIVFGGKAIGSLMAGSKADPNANLVRRDSNTPNMLQLRSDQPTPMLNRGDVNPPPKKMPPEVLEWLKHLERCEKEKNLIHGDQVAEMSLFAKKFEALGPLMGYSNPYQSENEDDSGKEPETYTKTKFEDLRPRWNRLIDFFRSVPPPDECRPLAEDFGRALNEVPGMTTDINDQLNKLQSDPTDPKVMQSIMKMQGKSYDSIDRYFERSDNKLSEICSKYNTDKWFNIVSNINAGLLGKFSGIGGGGMGSFGGLGGN